jgi:hypothetical protein
LRQAQISDNFVVLMQQCGVCSMHTNNRIGRYLGRKEGGLL